LGWIGESGVKTGPWIYSQIPTTYETYTQTHMNITYVNTYVNETYTKKTEVISYYNTTSTVTVTEPVIMRTAFSSFYQVYKIASLRHAFSLAFPIIFIFMVVLVITNALNKILVLMKLGFLQFGEGTDCLLYCR
jgi:hypothetical protein